MRKIALVLVALISLSIMPSNAFSAATPDEHWTSPLPTVNGQVGVSFDDREDYFYIGALRALVIKDGVYTGPICKSLTDTACAGASYFAIKAILSPCTAASQLNCVEGITARKPDGTVEKGQFVGFVTDDSSFFWQGDSSKNIPDSKVESLWNFPTIGHSGGKDFLLNAILDGSYREGSQPDWKRLVAMIQPVSKQQDSVAERARAFGNDRLDFVTREQVAIAGGWTGAQRGGLYKNCATAIDGACFRREPFPEGVSYSLSVRTNSQVSGWIHGRMQSPEVSIIESGNAWITTVGGLPTEVPVVTKWFDNNEFSGELKNAFSGAAKGSVGNGPGVVAERYGTTGQFNSVTINRLNTIRPFIKDTSSANPKIWSFGGIEPIQLASDVAVLGGKGFCVRDAKGLTGIVTTNATTYDGSIPAYSEKDQTLNYLVSAPHYAANGTEFLGTYDLVIRADIARCIYGFNKTPTSATVSIVRGDTVEKVSTTTLTEKDGWLSLAAYGFTFSTPKISVKLNRALEEIPVTTAAVASATQESTNAAASTAVKPAPKKAVVKSIYCAKANARKLVKGNNPKCPKGYKLVK